MPNDKDFKRLIRQRMTETGEPYTAARAAIERQPSPQLWERWVELLDDARHANGAQELLASLPSSQRRSASLAGLRHESWRVRRRCCQLLDDLTLTPESIESLTACLGDPHEKVRQAALHSLSCEHCKPDGCVLDLRPLFERMANDASVLVRKTVVAPLGWNPAFDQEWATALLRRVAATDCNASLRAAAVDALAGQEQRRDLDRQRRLLPDELRQKTERHPGKWVAVAGGRIVSASRTPGQIRRHLRGTGITDATVYWVAPSASHSSATA